MHILYRGITLYTKGRVVVNLNGDKVGGEVSLEVKGIGFKRLQHRTAYSLKIKIVFV